MNATIPGLHSANQALKHIPEMAGARVVGLLSNGPGNRSYRVEHQGENYLLRLDKPEAAGLGLNRNNEKLISAVVAAAGLAPGHLYFEPDQGISFRRFLPGRSWIAADLDRRDNMDRLVVILRRLHRLEPVGVPFEPLPAARRYADQINTPESWNVLVGLQAIAERINALVPRQAICHNDLLCQNILESDRLMLIDWEYTGLGDPFFDLAVVVQHHDLSSVQANEFLTSYLQHPPTPGEAKHLRLQCQFYSHLLSLWNQIHN